MVKYEDLRSTRLWNNGYGNMDLYGIIEEQCSHQMSGSLDLILPRVGALRMKGSSKNWYLVSVGKRLAPRP